ncbi:MAG: hypothetical protein A2066_09220 [Bacteroidetes bacterium GWB2_41_8]|nr:MAG: hypothetical protein A2066_09220 [Bacteroidetes bacterium GWB2_41_8]
MPTDILLFIVFGFLLIVGLFSGFFEKVTGIKIHTHSAFNRPSNAYLNQKEREDYERIMKELSKIDPEIVSQARKNVESSIYANTIQNVLLEAQKLKRIKEQGTYEERIKRSFKLVVNKIQTDKISNQDLERLEKLFKLKEAGVISEAEYNKEKDKIIK